MKGFQFHIFCLLLIAAAFAFLAPAQAQVKPEPRLAVEKEITVEKDLRELTNLNGSTRALRKFRLFDFETLEIISSRDEISRIYELFPHSPAKRSRLAAVNLYRNDLASTMPLRVDMRISTKLTFETRTPYVDSLIILDPFKQRVRIGFSHEFATGTMLTGFLDPLRQEVLGILAQRLNDFTEVNLVAFHSEKTNKSDAFVSLKFIF